MNAAPPAQQRRIVYNSRQTQQQYNKIHNCKC